MIRTNARIELRRTAFNARIELCVNGIPATSETVLRPDDVVTLRHEPPVGTIALEID
jgi:hypothetical protein